MPSTSSNPPTSPPTASAISRAKALAEGHVAPTLSGGFYPLPDPQMTHPDNTTVFIGGLPGSVGREELEAVFRPFGEVTYVNVPPGKSCGFISFDNRSSAEWAIEQLQGFWLHGTQLRLAWGRSTGEKARSQSSDLSSSIKSDLSFFTTMLELSADQKVKLGLYMEFASSGNLGRLKDIMSAKTISPSSAELSPPIPSAPRIVPTHSRRPISPCSCAPLPASRHDPYQSHGELCQHYDRLVSDTDTPPEQYDHSSSPDSSTPPLSRGSVSAPTDISPLDPISPHTSFSTGIHRHGSSIGSDHVFRSLAFQPWKTDNNHKHSENCITPIRLQQLDNINQKSDPVERLGWGLRNMGLNVKAGEWVPSGPKGMRGSGGYQAHGGNGPIW